MPMIPMLIPALACLSARMQSVYPHHRPTSVATVRNAASTCLQKVRQGPTEERPVSQEEQSVRERSLQCTRRTRGLSRLTLPKCQPLSTASSCGSSRPFGWGRGTGGLDSGWASYPGFSSWRYSLRVAHGAPFLGGFPIFGLPLPCLLSVEMSPHAREPKSIGARP